MINSRWPLLDRNPSNPSCAAAAQSKAIGHVVGVGECWKGARLLAWGPAILLQIELAQRGEFSTYSPCTEHGIVSRVLSSSVHVGAKCGCCLLQPVQH